MVNFAIDEVDDWFSDWWEDFLEDYDIDVTQCTQSFDITIVHVE